MKRIVAIFTFILVLASTGYAAEEATTSEAVASAAQPSAAPLTPRSEPNPARDRIQELIKKTSPGAKLLQLDTEKEGEKLLGLYRTEGTGFTQGGIIIFPDQSAHMAWTDDLKFLREGLADFGWYTLALYLPQPSPTPIPKRTLPVLSSIKPTTEEANTADSADEGNKEPSQETERKNDTPETGANDEAISPTTEENEAQIVPQETHEEQIYRLGKTAINHMQTTDNLDRFIVIGVGTGATWAAKYVEKYQEEQDLRLLMIDAKNPTGEGVPDLLNILPEIKDTIIDLHHSDRITQDNKLIPESPANRLRLARHKRMNNFHQSRMPAMSDNWKRNNSWLLKQVRGMINTYVIKAEQANRSIPLKTNQPQNEQPPG